MSTVECIREALRGSEFYSAVKFFRDEEAAAEVAVIIACVLAPVTLLLGRKHLKALANAEGCPQRVKRWYLVLAGFPTVAVVQSWLSVVVPSVSNAFEVVYISYEAVCLVCFAYVLLLLSGEPFERFLDRSTMGQFCAELCASSGHCSKDGGDESSHLRYRIKFVYQMLILAPLCALFRSICEFADTNAANTVYPIFSIGLLLSTITAAFNILLLWCCILKRLPEASKIHRKFFTFKGMIFVSNIQMIIIGLILSCGGSGDAIFKKPVAQNVWSNLIFLAELPALQLLFSWAYPASDLTTLYADSSLEDSLLSTEPKQTAGGPLRISLH